MIEVGVFSVLQVDSKFVEVLAFRYEIFLKPITLCPFEQLDVIHVSKCVELQRALQVCCFCPPIGPRSIERVYRSSM